ncbi:uncharacterized protein LOC126681933 [Mercurialis annua]|uniref:uncharacterized protein LOC126681933 n=1 Tax=Mercurialis annua TaxID=3986 RepID=UPI0021600871|nr:uncharacterized protein LOC126681933 [Mercurialis annua]
MFQIHQKLKACRHEIIKWKTQNNSNAKAKIDYLTQQLQRAKTQAPVHIHWPYIKQLEQQLYTARKQEEDFWNKSPDNADISNYTTTPHSRPLQGEIYNYSFLDQCRVSYFCPISLCSVFYKIISKILTSRLQHIIHVLVSQNQNAFTKGRSISDNILLAHEMLHYLKTKTKGNSHFMALKLDISKAYGKLEWPYIKSILQAWGFHPVIPQNN